MLGIDDDDAAKNLFAAHDDDDDGADAWKEESPSGDEDDGDLGINGDDDVEAPGGLRPFPPQPHDVKKILTWARTPRRFSKDEVLVGLSYMNIMYGPNWTIWSGPRLIGKLHCKAGKFVRIKCCYHPAIVTRSATGKVTSEDCRCSLRLRTNFSAPELMNADIDLLLWCIAGTVMTADAHLAMGHALHRESIAKKN